MLRHFKFSIFSFGYVLSDEERTILIVKPHPAGHPVSAWVRTLVVPHATIHLRASVARRRTSSPVTPSYSNRCILIVRKSERNVKQHAQQLHFFFEIERLFIAPSPLPSLLFLIHHVSNQPSHIRNAHNQRQSEQARFTRSREDKTHV